MFSAKLIYGLHIYAFFVSLVLIYGLFLQRKEKFSRLFLCIVLLDICGLFSDVVYELGAGRSGAGIRAYLRLNDFFNHVLAMWIFCFAVEFLWRYLEDKDLTTPVDRKYPRLVWLTASLGTLYIAIGQWFCLFADFDANNYYYDTRWYWLSMAAPLLVLFSAVPLYFNYYKKLERRDRRVFSLVYGLTNILLMILLVIHTDFTLVYISYNLILLILYANIYTERAYALRERRLIVQQNKIAAMLLKIHPDFVYACLGRIERLCVPQPKEAKTELIGFTRHLRARLDAIVPKRLISFEEELSHLQNYLAFEEKRLDGTVGASYDIQSVDFSLPPMTIQSIVEAMVYENSAANASPWCIRVATRETAESNVVEIRCPFPFAVEKSASRDLLLSALGEGLSTLCRGRIEMESQPGACIRTIIPKPKGVRHHE